MKHRNPKKAQSLLKASEGATHASVVTANAAEALKSGTLSKRDLIKLSSHLEKAAKAMEIVKENTDVGAGQLGGAGTKYAHQRFKVFDENAKREQTPGRAPKATPLTDLTDFVKTAREKRKNRENLSRTAKKKPEVVLPVPANMVKYTQSEAGGILAAVSNCGDAIKEMHRLGYTDLSIKRLYELSKLVKNGTPILNRHKGRPALATVPQIKEFVSTATEGGNTVGSREMRIALMGFEEERRRSSGISAIGLKIHPKVVQLYVGAAAAHRLLGAGLLLKASAPVPARLAVPVVLRDVAPLVVTAATGLAAVSGELPSVMLRNGAWLASVYLNVLGCPDAFLDGSPTTADYERADLLRELLYARLQTHKDARVEVASKRTSWVFEWMEENLAPVAAISVAFGHVHDDLDATTGQTTLLSAREERFVLASNAMSLAEGCYTHKDKNTGLWVRSGKVVGKERNFAVRNAEHARCSQLLTLPDLASRFYCSYPAQSSEVQTGAARRGYFGSLEQYVGLGFMRTNEEAVNALCSSTSEDRLLSWSASHLELIAAVNFPGTPSVVEKQLHMVGYLFELVYDLMISPRDNVSHSPGFEIPLGILGGS